MVDRAEKTTERRKNNVPKGRSHPNFGMRFGRLFAKGEVTNPGGRPKKDRRIDELCKNATDDCVRMLHEIVLSDEEKSSDRVAAAQWLMSYAWGRPKQQVDISGEVTVQDAFIAALKAVNEEVLDGTAEEQPALPTPDDVIDVEVVEEPTSKPEHEPA